MASGWCWMVMNLQDSCSNHHPTTTRGFRRTVNWNLNGAQKSHPLALEYLTRHPSGALRLDSLLHCTLSSVGDTACSSLFPTDHATRDSEARKRHWHSMRRQGMLRGLSIYWSGEENRPCHRSRH